MAHNPESLINEIWPHRETLTTKTQGPIREAIEETLLKLDQGQLRVASLVSGEWSVHAWIKKAILLSFRLNDSDVIDGGPVINDKAARWYDKVPLKCASWGLAEFEKAGFRMVPGAVVRQSAYVAPDVVLMPCFVNVGAWIGEHTMIDSWATIGSCAQIGRQCHISGGVGIGGVLEPPQAAPVIIEDNCFIGARSEVAEGVQIGQGSVLSMGVFISASTPIVDRQTGTVYRGYVPPYSVVVPGSLPPSREREGLPSLACAVIVKQVDAQTRQKTAINDLLRL